MEKKTIGGFIAALRRANGITQQELADKLNVSNKAVSCWERDECAPDISLIPAIAEIFGVTCDELLRGERVITDVSEPEGEEQASRPSARGDKQFRSMLRRRLNRYRNSSLISFGISVIGLIAAMIANLAFSEGLIALCIATAFIAVSEISQIGFLINTYITVDDDDDAYIDRIREANTKMVGGAVRTSFVNLVLLAFCLPLVTVIDGANFGLEFGSWLGIGGLFAGVALVASYVIYVFAVRRMLVDRGIIFMNDRESARISCNTRLLLKTLIGSGTVAVLLGVAIFVLNLIASNGWAARKETFEKVEDFTAYMELQYDAWYENGSKYYYYSHEDGTIVSVSHDSDVIVGEEAVGGSEEDSHPHRVTRRVSYRDGSGYFEFYYNPRLYYDISFTDSEDSIDRMPVTVITKESYYEAMQWIVDIESILSVAIAFDFAAAAVFYCVSTFKKRR